MPRCIRKWLQRRRIEHRATSGIDRFCPDTGAKLWVRVATSMPAGSHYDTRTGERQARPGLWRARVYEEAPHGIRCPRVHLWNDAGRVSHHRLTRWI